MNRRVIGLLVGMIMTYAVVGGTDFGPNGNVGSRDIRRTSSANEITPLPDFDPKDPDYLRLVESLRIAKESGNHELINSAITRIRELTGVEWTSTPLGGSDGNITFLPGSDGLLTVDQFSRLKGYEWKNKKIYNVSDSVSCYGDIGDASVACRPTDTLYAVFDYWSDLDQVWGIKVYRSTDNGEHWRSAAGFCYSAPIRDYRYPTLGMTNGGELLIVYFVDNVTGNDWVKVAKITFNGSVPSYDWAIASDTAVSVYCPYYTDRPRIVVDYPHTFTYAVNVAYQVFQGGWYYLKVAMSSDENQSYTQSTLSLHTERYDGWDMMYINNDGGSGDYLLHARPRSPGIWFLRSVDYGVSWSPTGLDTIATSNDIYYPTIGGVDGSDQVFCAWQMDVASRHVVYGRYSSDRGENWSSSTASVFFPGSGNVYVPVIQERTFDDTYYMTAFYKYGPGGNIPQVLVGYADIATPDAWDYDMIRNDLTPQSSACAPRIVTRECGGYEPMVIWTDARDGNYDIYFGKRVNQDVALAEVHWPSRFNVTPETTDTPSARVANVGAVGVVDLPVVLEIMNVQEPADHYVDTVIVDTILAGDSIDVFFREWTAGTHPTSYTALAYTLLEGDLDPENDTLDNLSFTACNRKSASTWGTPTLDGLLDTLQEWSEAGKMDISETAGWDNPNAQGSCILYALNDSGNLYLGIDYKIDGTLDPKDFCWFAFDEDHDGEWNEDSSEGRYSFLYADSFLYTGYMVPTWNVANPPGFNVEPALIGGRVTYEIKLPLGPGKTDLTANPGDTLGIAVFVRDYGAPDYGGWYPQDYFISTQPGSPKYMASLALATISGTEENPVEKPRFALDIKAANPAKRRPGISFSVPKAMHVKLSVYDLSGRTVARLADRAFKPGTHTIQWRSEALNGIYFIRLDAGEHRITRKLVMMD